MLKLNTEITKDMKLKQAQALDCMKKIAYARNKLKKTGYMHELRCEDYGKKIFSDFVEHYVAYSLNLEPSKKVNEKGWDAKNKTSKKTYQIKEITLSAPTITNKNFDYLITVKLAKKDFSIDEIAIFPNSKVLKSMDAKGKFRLEKKEFEKFVCYKNKKWLRKEINCDNKLMKK